MAIETELVSRIKEKLGINVRPLKFAEGEKFPVIVYQYITGIKKTANDGVLELTDAKIQFTIFGKNYSELKQLKNSLSNIVLGYKNIYRENTTLELYEPDTKLYQVVIDYDLFHK